MKNSRMLSMMFVIIYFVCGFSTMAQAQTSITNSQIFTALESSQIELPEGVEVEYKSTGSKRVRVETVVTSSNTKYSILEFLSKQLYFHVSALENKETNVLKLSMSKLELAKNTIIQGVQIELKVKLIIYLPENMNFLTQK